jgi:MoaA/NifB/PqqE/SkfB family radical SAM enzyme
VRTDLAAARAASTPAPPYQIEADWQLLNTCNFRCAYCFISPKRLGEKLRPAAAVADWRAAFDATGYTWLLHMTGGEPSIYPHFAQLCQSLTERHFISLNSNLTHPALLAFAERVDPARVSFINAGLHLAERAHRGGHAEFLRHAERLRAGGFPIFVSLVSTPEVLARYDEAVALLAPIGLYPIPKLLRESFEGRKYPQAYDEADRERFRARAAEARAFYDAALDGRVERPSIDMFSDDQFLHGVPGYRGLSCEAGHTFVSLAPNGDVARCSTRTRLGNLLDGTFAPLLAPTPCDTGYCFYWCEKYVRRPAVAVEFEFAGWPGRRLTPTAAHGRRRRRSPRRTAAASWPPRTGCGRSSR